MTLKTSLFIFILLIGVLSGLALILKGVQKKTIDNTNFEYKKFFSNFNAHPNKISGTQLILEGFFTLIVCFVILIFIFMK